MGRSDSRSALAPFAGSLLIGFAAPGPPPGRHPRGLTARAETGLSCSHDGCPTVPRPIRRGVPRGCTSKRFAPSLAFAHPLRARLPVGPLAGQTSRRGRLRFMLRTGGLHPSRGRARPRASTPGSPLTPAGCYKGGLVPPLAGLAPASRRELPGRTVTRLCPAGSGLVSAGTAGDSPAPAARGGRVARGPSQRPASSGLQQWVTPE